MPNRICFPYPLTAAHLEVEPNCPMPTAMMQFFRIAFQRRHPGRTPGWRRAGRQVASLDFWANVRRLAVSLANFCWRTAAAHLPTAVRQQVPGR